MLFCRESHSSANKLLVSQINQDGQCSSAFPNSVNFLYDYRTKAMCSVLPIKLTDIRTLHDMEENYYSYSSFFFYSQFSKFGIILTFNTIEDIIPLFSSINHFLFQFRHKFSGGNSDHSAFSPKWNSNLEGRTKKRDFILEVLEMHLLILKCIAFTQVIPFFFFFLYLGKNSFKLFSSLMCFVILVSN